ncbi:uncharacterized protein BO97DRAFT_423543 [Aspergillus homomorphus CBS 101889]|uniref:Uncharacterized protein n=1 Tax=Aspergillus homomorphus (strain CBS 101889) TaxID=1450537 RepID=A0A395HZG9_ASPHC|nr:hypothetical protein BO97DRAFT_423543 [Aspergillus homomorphus CBS 101889]RAL13332.1 hypothetical protein BO97DRAFT_423543 [Aspergillus homomorphus CBS 101889]
MRTFLPLLSATMASASALAERGHDGFICSVGSVKPLSFSYRGLYDNATLLLTYFNAKISDGFIIEGVLKHNCDCPDGDFHVGYVSAPLGNIQ